MQQIMNSKPNTVSETHHHGNHSVTDCEIELTLPKDFVRKWVISTRKQHWTAQMKNCGQPSKGQGCQRKTLSPPVSPTVTYTSESVSVLLETNTSVMKDEKGERKSYVKLKITGVTLHPHDHKLQLTVLDFKGTGLNIVETKAKHSVSLSRPSGGATLPSVVSDDFRVQRPHQMIGYPEPFSLYSESAGSCPNSASGFNQASDHSVVGQKSASKEYREAAAVTLSKRMTEDCSGERRTTVVQSLTSQHPYNLRHKKLSFSKFGSSEFEVELNKESGDENCFRHLRKSSAKKLDDLTLQGYLTGEKESQHKKENQQSILPKVNHGRTNPQTGENSWETATPALSWSTTSPSNAKGGQPSSTLSKSASRMEQPTKKKRMKITIAGLPRFNRRAPSKGRKARCRYCQQKFCDYTGVAVHARKLHRGERDVEEYLQELKPLCVTTCSLCGKRCENRFQLHQHEDKIHFKAGDMECDRCGKVFNNALLLKQHVRSVHLVQGQDHACSICSARFKWAATLKTHITEVHKGVRNRVCTVCGKNFHRQAQLNRHSVIHGPEEDKLVCEICGRKFWYSSNLQRHKAIVHRPRSEAWHCAYCGNGFHRKEGLSNHVEKVHYSLFPHHCQVCNAGFIRQILLEKHMATKHGQPGVHAPVNGPAHFRHSRRDQGKFGCGLCEETFCYKAQLVQHVFRAHRHTFPFRCELCQQVFTQRSFLVLHRERAHHLQPGLQDGDCDGEDGSSVQQNQAGVRHQTHHSPDSFAAKRTTSGEETGTVLVVDEKAHTIRLGSGDGDVQYVIQVPDRTHAASPDVIFQCISNLLTSQQTMQQAQANTNGPASLKHSPDAECLQDEAVTATSPEKLQAFPQIDYLETSHEGPKQDLVSAPPSTEIAQPGERAEMGDADTGMTAPVPESGRQSLLAEVTTPYEQGWSTVPAVAAGGTACLQGIAVSEPGLVHDMVVDSTDTHNVAAEDGADCVDAGAMVMEGDVHSASKKFILTEQSASSTVGSISQHSVNTASAAGHVTDSTRADENGTEQLTNMTSADDFFDSSAEQHGEQFQLHPAPF